MFNYLSATIVLLIALVLLVIALYSSCVAYQQLGSPTLDTSNTDVGYVRSILLFMIIVDVFFILITVYGIIKIRTSNIGGWFGFVIGLILIICILIFGIIAITKTNGVIIPDVLKALVWNTIIIPIAFVHFIVSIWIKPRINGVNMTKKIISEAREKLNEIDQSRGTEYVEEDITFQPVSRTTRVVKNPVAPLEESLYVPPSNIKSVPSRNIALL
jgi:hypothetical protein